MTATSTDAPPEQPPFHIYTVRDRPDIAKALDEPDHPLHYVWPEFIPQDLFVQIFQPFLSRLDYLRRFQFLAVERDSAGDHHIVGLGRSVPFFWPEVATLHPDEVVSQNRKVLNTLPDGGFDTVLAHGVQQCLAREGLLLEPLILTPEQQKDAATSRSKSPPNALSAVLVSVRPDRRQKGIAEALLLRMKQAAIDGGLRTLVVPLRPTMKPKHPHVDIADYIQWMADDSSSGDNNNNNDHHHKDDPGLEPATSKPFDPWLRKYLRLGGKVIKVARQSMLVPVQYSIQEKIGVYVEPNVWTIHELKECRDLRSTMIVASVRYSTVR